MAKPFFWFARSRRRRHYLSAFFRRDACNQLSGYTQFEICTQHAFYALGTNRPRSVTEVDKKFTGLTDLVFSLLLNISLVFEHETKEFSSAVVQLCYTYIYIYVYIGLNLIMTSCPSLRRSVV